MGVLLVLLVSRMDGVGLVVHTLFSCFAASLTTSAVAVLAGECATVMELGVLPR